jgi:hypothetical protein
MFQAGWRFDKITVRDDDNAFRCGFDLQIMGCEVVLVQEPTLDMLSVTVR